MTIETLASAILANPVAVQLGLGVVLVLSVVLLLRTKQRLTASKRTIVGLEQKYRPIIDIDSFITERKRAFADEEEQDRIREEREREREEAKAQRELQAEIKRAEKREEERREALASARSELAAAGEVERIQLEKRVEELQEQLKKAHEITERTMSMAQQTRVGYVYIISNVGAFGEQTFKIGMTRRLDPLDRVRELGDASVPFPFEVHALIFTEDAPSLERELHIALEDVRVNRVNLRKEFFRAPADRVAKIVRERFPNVHYVERPESREYLASLTTEEAKLVVEIRTEALPLTI